MFKKTLLVIMIFSLTLLGANTRVLNGQTFETVTEEYDIVNYDGTYNEERIVQMTFHNNETYRQRYNYLTIDNNDEDIHLVTINNYIDDKWGMTPLEGMIRKFERENPNIEVIGGINGDFYDIKDTGHPIGTYIEDYEVIKGSPSRNVFNIRSNGTYDIGVPQKDGYEILIIDRNNEVKYRNKLDVFNNEITNENQVGVIFNTYDGPINKELDYINVKAKDIKYTGKTFERAKGYADLDNLTTNIDKNSFLIHSKGLKENLEETDKILVQHKLTNYEDVRGTIGGGDVLVEDAKIGKTVDGLTGFLQRAPRTAVGIKEDGSVFFIVTDGRNETKGIPGTTLEETGYLMMEHGAVSALNLDGGGSSTMMVKDKEGNFKVLNEMSDGNMRSISNGILIVRGDINEQPLHIKGEDTRDQFKKIDSLYIDSDNNLIFDEVENATRYIVTMGKQTLETSKTKVSLNSLTPGDYEISVRVKGNINAKTSEESSVLFYKSKMDTTSEIIDWLRNFTKNQ